MSAGMNPGAAAAQGLVIDDSEKGQQKAEVDAGLRCAGCRRRIAIGFEFIRATTWRAKGDLSGKRMSSVEHVYTCDGRGGCDAMLNVARNSTAVRRIDCDVLFLDNPKVAALLHNTHAATNSAMAGPAEPNDAVPADDAPEGEEVA